MSVQVGPLRDLLAKLSEATRGGGALSVGDIATRVGWPYEVARRRLEDAVAHGWAAHAQRDRYVITDEGRKMLGG